MAWDDDPLAYGYILVRPPEGGWWHLHFALGAARYPCRLLGRPTNVLACLQRFAAGAVASSRRFILTLDGEGVELPDDAPLDFDWADTPAAADFQRSVVPVLHDSPAFQDATAEVVRSLRHLQVVAPGLPADAEPCAAADPAACGVFRGGVGERPGR